MSLERVLSCPICSGNTFKHIHTCKDNTTSGQLFDLEQCEGCQLLITSPRPPKEKAYSYYLSEKYISHKTSGGGLMDRIYLIVRLFSLRWKYRLVKRHIHNNQLLDIGCGTGNFLSECKRHGLEVHGVEPSSEARSKAPSTIPIVSSMDYLPKIKFGAITLWHVLEHTYDLIQMLEQIKIMLLDNGTIFIAVPNCESDDAQHYKEAWAAYDVPRHVWHFSKLTMHAALKRANLKVHAIIPMKLDAYYVSLLSEKNKSEGQLSVYGSLKAILAGLRSNLRGKRGMNYSSLLYIVQK